VVIVIRIELAGYAKIFAAVPPAKLLLAVPQATSTGAYDAYATLALGSAFDGLQNGVHFWRTP
jgi:SSS family solute:Na+ symporter